MTMRKSLRQWPVMLFGCVLVVVLAIEAREEPSQTTKTTNQRSDLLTIDTLKSFGPLERPEVLFFHDLHTDYMEKNNKDCTVCHPSDPEHKDRLSLKFKRFKDVDRKSTMDLYHTECISCHKEAASADRKTGPVEVCGDCHKEKTEVSSLMQPLSFDKSLHYRHVEANKDMKTGKGDCGKCHHEYDKERKNLFYAKGKEGSCRYCHGIETVENRMSMRLASHAGCIDCHRKKLSDKKESGPFKCSGCHDPEMQKKIKIVENVPRIDRKQPDAVLLTGGYQPDADNKTELLSGMNPVPFDHKSHEVYAQSCIVCHHQSLESCTKTCHTPSGAKEGDFVSLERAAHQLGSNQSCLGCHSIKQDAPNCKVCHGVTRTNKKADTGCQTCHIKPMEEVPRDDLEARKVMAEKMLGERTPNTGIFPDEDIPEKVIIKRLSDKYEPVELPHRKIIKTLLANIKADKLAGYFHPEKGTLCRGCHHNSPVALKPPACASCHGKPFNKGNLLVPGIKAAYHQQCMGCHETLNMEKPKSTSCADCHKEKRQFVSR